MSYQLRIAIGLARFNEYGSTREPIVVVESAGLIGQTEEGFEVFGYEDAAVAVGVLAGRIDEALNAASAEAGRQLAALVPEPATEATPDPQELR